MNEDAHKILDYFPIIREEQIQKYLEYLWDSFLILDKQENSSRSFAVFPYYLMFILAIQYKVYRLSKYFTKEYLEITKNLNCSKIVKESLSKNILGKMLSAGSSVLNISILNDKHMFTYMDIIDPGKDISEQGKQFAHIRNGYAHASGNIEHSLDDKITEYLELLSHLQKKIDLRLNPLTEVELIKQNNKHSLFSRTESSYMILNDECLAKEDFRSGKLLILRNSFPSLKEIIDID
jgi:hypothetical protein